MTRADRWRADLAAWRIPDDTLAGVDESPWGFPEGLFEQRAEEAAAGPPSISHIKSLEALAGGGTVLDVGCGGGAASLPLRPSALRIVGVDSTRSMLDGFARLAARLGVEVETVLGEWPACAAEVEPADVVVCHHVVYNVPDLLPFVRELTAHAKRRVVVELTRRHPLTGLNPLWMRFHGMARPTVPTVDDAIAVIRETGVVPVRVDWERSGMEASFQQRSPRAYAQWIRRRLCLPPARIDEVEAAIAEAGGPASVGSAGEVATLWWDTAATPGPRTTAAE